MRTNATRMLLGVLLLVTLLPAGCSGGERPTNPLAGVSPAAVLQNRPELALARSPEYDYDPPEPGTYTLPVIKPAADGDVLGPDGEPAELSELMDGRITILSFIYTRCADPRACPRASGVLHTVHRLSEQDPLLARHLQLITMSFDPLFDTPDRMAAYGRGYGSDAGGSEWLFLTTRSHRELDPILDAYGQHVAPKKDAGDAYGPFYHQVRVYLIDRRGRIRNIYSFGLMDPRMLLSDVRTLLLEELAEQA